MKATMLKLDLLRLSLTGHLRELANSLVEKWDTQGRLSEYEAKTALELVERFTRND